MVIKQYHNSFILQFELEEDLSFMLNHGSCLLQGYFIVLGQWNPKISLVDISAQDISLWVQVHGLPKNLYNEQISKFLGNSLSKFICYDTRSMYNDFGSRLKIYLSKKGFDSRKLCNLFLVNGEIRKMSLVLEQVGRFCPSCLSLGHVAQHCQSVFYFTLSVIR